MSTDPYQPPSRTEESVLASRPDRGRAVAITGLVLLVLGSLASAAITVVMGKAFGLLAKSGSADPADLAEAISGVLWITLIGMLFTLIGAVVMAISLLGNGNRERWLFVVSMLVFVLQLGTLPLGTPIGIFLLFIGILKRGEFVPKLPSTH